MSTKVLAINEFAATTTRSPPSRTTSFVVDGAAVHGTDAAGALSLAMTARRVAPVNACPSPKLLGEGRGRCARLLRLHSAHIDHDHGRRGARGGELVGRGDVAQGAPAAAGTRPGACS